MRMPETTSPVRLSVITGLPHASEPAREPPAAVKPEVAALVGDPFKGRDAKTASRELFEGGASGANASVMEICQL
jgi:hypothetical protein